MNYVRNFVYSGMASLTPISNNSSYAVTGRITPQEFILSCDCLIRNYPCWYWMSTMDRMKMSYLPSSKQYLTTTNVPCKERCGNHLESNQLIDADGYMQITGSSNSEHGVIEAPSSQVLPIQSQDVLDNMWIEEEEFDPFTVISTIDLPKLNPNLRLYTMDITYDHVYQCPRLWIQGKDIYGNILDVHDIMQDISSDHGHKTVTIERHPFTQMPCLSIHPCQHANMIRALGPAMGNANVSHALRHFLQMAITIMPTVDLVSHI